jgi:hypothetical protein
VVFFLLYKKKNNFTKEATMDANHWLQKAEQIASELINGLQYDQFTYTQILINFHFMKEEIQKNSEVIKDLISAAIPIYNQLDKVVQKYLFQEHDRMLEFYKQYQQKITNILNIFIEYLTKYKTEYCKTN